jgi:hypothetical protein
MEFNKMKKTTPGLKAKMIAVFIGICLYELLSILPEYLSADFLLDWFSIA